ncbi:MAG: YeeE/YedE family protein [Caulobacterales bacterium]|uniref:YeeE/YedE family protein n=1 Tax=Glycocaulis sp. TaxID=1969725 RepID=UPI003F9F00A1
MEMPTPFTPLASLAGGVLIGLSAVMLMAFNGRIAGIAGIVGGLVGPAPFSGLDRFWRLAFVAGLVLAPVLWFALTGAMPQVSVTPSWPMLALAGLIVGVGTQIGSGCTSGHGVCGLARLSPRSLVATLIFMAAALATVFITRHLV